MKSLQELAAIRDRMKQTVNTREAAHDHTRYRQSYLCKNDPREGFPCGGRAFDRRKARDGIHHRCGHTLREGERYTCTEVM